MPQSAELVKTRLLILSDTHGIGFDQLSCAHANVNADVAIHCGDLTMTGKLEEHEKAFELLKSLPAPLKIVIPGNHDLTLDRKYCATHNMLHGWTKPVHDLDLKSAHHLYHSDEARASGIVFIEEGFHRFKLANGAQLCIYASAYTPEFCDWAFSYPRIEDRFNQISSRVPDFEPLRPTKESCAATIMLTHGPPYGILDQTNRGEHVGCEHLMTAVARCRPLLHCFGHIHENWGMALRAWDDVDTLEQMHTLDAGYTPNSSESVVPVDLTSMRHGKETAFVNASIMDLQYRPQQKPFQVDLLLPRDAS